MIFIWFIPIILSHLVLAAHFLRDGNTFLFTLTLAVLPLLFIKKRWIIQLFRIVLFLGAVEWLRTIWILVNERMAFNQPYLRMSIILGVVCLFTFCSIFVFNSKRLKTRYAENGDLNTSETGC